jgi:hypothetical protein
MKSKMVMAAAAVLLGAPLLGQSSSSMPDVTQLYHQRVNCHGAYDALVQTARDGGESTDEEFAFAEAYETAAVEGQPCPAVPDSLAGRAANRTVSHGETINRLARYIDQDDPLAFYEAGRAALAGNVDGVGDEGGVEFIKKAADLGDPEAIFYLSRLHLGGSFGTPLDFASAIPLFDAAARGGHIDGMVMRALAHYEGKNGPKNLPAAFQLFQQAAERGHVYAAYMTAYMANEGEGTRKDHELAYRLARNLAAQGEVVGAVLAASALLQQNDRRAHEEEVLYWMDAAAEYGDERIRTEMSRMRPQVVEIYGRLNAPPPAYEPPAWKACPMKTVCLVNQYTSSRSCTTNKDYWSDCDG